MAYQLSTLLTELQNRLDDSDFSTSLLTIFLNDAQREYTNDKKLRFMEDTQDYTVTIDDPLLGTLPADYQMPIDLRITTPLNEAMLLPYIDYKTIDLYYPNPELLGSTWPMGWYEFANNIYLLPAPSTAYTAQLRYIKTATELVNPSDVPVIPEEFKELLILGALWRAHEFNDDYDKSLAVQAQAARQLVNMTKRLGVRQLGQVHIMKR